MAVIIGLVVCTLLHYQYFTLCKNSKYVDSYKKRHLDTSLSVPTEEFLNSSVETFYSPRRGKIKLRKNEMELRKNEMKVRKNFSVSRWIIQDLYGGIS